MTLWKKLKPGLQKKWLHLLAGLIWSAVGYYLIYLTRDWIKPAPKPIAIWVVVAGILLALVIYRFGFSKLANKNIHRIDALKSDKPCIFAFQEWTSYPLVMFMISLGIFLRVYSPIPKIYLAGMYIAIGFNIFLASLHYYKRLWNPKTPL